MSMVRRTAHFSARADALLTSRAAAEGVTKAELIRKFAESFLENLPESLSGGSDGERRRLRSFFVSEGLYKKIASAAKALRVSKGRLLRAAVAQGLGLPAEPAAAKRSVVVAEGMPPVLADIAKGGGGAVLRAAEKLASTPSRKSSAGGSTLLRK